MAACPMKSKVASKAFKVKAASLNAQEVKTAQQIIQKVTPPQVCVQ